MARFPTSTSLLPAASAARPACSSGNVYTADTRHGDHIHLDWVDLAQKNSPPLYQSIPYKWSGSANTTGFGAALATAFAAPPSEPIAPPSVLAMPPWLLGWWKVYDGNTYYYFFGPGLEVHYTKTAPAQSVRPAANPMNKGRCALSGAVQNTVTINWNAADGGTTRETFTHQGARNDMNGTSNRYAPLYAVRMF